MPATLDELIALLDLEELEAGLYRGGQLEDTHFTRVFGGQVAAQALVAAQRTVPEERWVHSLHSYFLLGGDPAAPIIYDVQNVRDGGSFTTRRVAARQHGENIFYMTASFHKTEDGYDHQDRMPTVPSPDEAPRMEEVVGRFSPEAAERWKREWSALDMRYLGDPRAADDPMREREPAVQMVWFRYTGEIPDDRALANAVLTYFSDLTLLSVALVPHGKLISSPDIQPASLDHTIWFHRPIRPGEWILYDQHSPSASGARGLSQARVFGADGTLIATIAQEGLIRPVTPG